MTVVTLFQDYLLYLILWLAGVGTYMLIMSSITSARTNLIFIMVKVIPVVLASGSLFLAALLLIGMEAS